MSRNDITGDRIATRLATNKFREGWDGIFSKQRECNACKWIGPESETVMCGAVGPLCPDCRETTEVANCENGGGGK